MELIIRPAEYNDCSNILHHLCSVFGADYKTLANTYIQAAFSDAFRKPNFILALESDKIVGCAAYTEELFTTETWGIGWVSVVENFRKKCIGELLVKECLKEISLVTISDVTVILRTNPNQTGLYDKLGFKILGNDHEGGNFMALILKKIP